MLHGGLERNVLKDFHAFDQVFEHGIFSQYDLQQTQVNVYQDLVDTLNCWRMELFGIVGRE